VGLKLTNRHDSAKILFQNADDAVTRQNNKSNKQYGY